MRLEFHGRVNESGQLHIVNRKEFDMCVAASFAGKEVSLWIDRKTKKRSNQQNRYYHGCVLPIIRNAFRDLGHRMDSEDVHDFLKDKFLKGVEVANKDGVYIGELRKTTTILTTSQFMDYLAEIREWAASILDIEIPEPMEQTSIELSTPVSSYKEVGV